ncbi:hypothetical protein CPB85DRAFT_1221944, partial [Mucidula mucida]
ASGAGFHPHLPGFKHNFLGKALGATMWFFIFYRARSDHRCCPRSCILNVPQKGRLRQATCKRSRLRHTVSNYHRATTPSSSTATNTERTTRIRELLYVAV